MNHNWTYKKVKEVCDKASSTIVLNKIENNSGDYALYGASGFVKGIDFYHRDKPYIGIVKDGAGVGRVNVYPAKSSLVGTMQYILPKENVLLHYLCYALQGLNLAKLVSGATIPHIYFKDYGEFPIPLPPLETQSRIVSELDLLQAIIDKQKAQLAELDNLAQCIFYDMFGDPVENDKGWDVKKLGEVCEIIAGGDKPEDISNIKTKDYCYPVIANGDGDKGILGYCRTKRVSCDAVTIGARGASIGNCRIVSGGFTPVVRLIVLMPNESVNCTYLFFFAKQMPYYSNGAGQAQLTVPNVRDVSFILPPLSLQQSFAAKIESIEKQKAAINQSIAETQKLFNFTMDKYFG